MRVIESEARQKEPSCCGDNAMKFRCTFSQLGSGEWSVRHVGPDVGTIEVTAGSQEEALEKMRGELRYRLEICPCTGELYQDVQIEITGQAGG